MHSLGCIKVTPYKDDEKLYLDPEQIIPMQDIGDYQIRLTAKKQEETISSKEEATRYKTRYRFWVSVSGNRLGDHETLLFT